MQEIRARQAQQAAEIRRLAQLSDEDLIAVTPANTSLSRPLPQMEMDRRLKNAVEALTGELVTFRESSDAAAGKLERLTRWLIGFTIVLVILTLAVVLLTAVLAAKG